MIEDPRPEADLLDCNDSIYYFTPMPRMICAVLVALMLSLLQGQASPVTSADAVALSIRIGKEKQLHRVVIALDSAAAPATVDNFKKLVRDHFYNGIAFHRVLPDYLVQAGDPLSRHSDRSAIGTGGPGYTLPGENSRRVLRGTVAMARLPDKLNPTRRSNGSQFFVALRPLAESTGGYTAFGRVLEGLDVLDRISHQSADSNDNPEERVIIKAAQLLTD
jgi:cyclophilin family peptidyl-prolyl cis-trans isomerase